MFVRLVRSNVLFWAVLSIILAGLIRFIQPVFFTSQNILLVLYYTSLDIPAVIGMYFLILLGLFDLSIGAIAGFCGVVYALATVKGLSFALSLGLALLTGCAVGLTNGLLVSTLGLPVLVATIITMFAVHGLATLVTSGRVVAGLSALDGGRIFYGIPGRIVGTLFASTALVISVQILSVYQIFVRRFYQVGSNKVEANVSGINRVYYRYCGFLLAGAGAAVVGITQADRTLAASPLAFPDLALDTIAACIIGGMSLTGGRGSAVGCALGALILVTSRNIVDIAGVGIYWNDIGVAALLLIAVVLRRA